MKLSVCTISFRHQLMSLEQIAQWAKRHPFHGIELWGAHVKNVAVGENNPLTANQLRATMISDYLPLHGKHSVAAEKTHDLCQRCEHWGSRKLRTFSGQKPSADVSATERRDMAARLIDICDIAADYGVKIVVETHPNTLADNVSSTLRLLDEVSHPALGINFDVIHIWEAGDDVMQSFKALEPHIVHLHLKNVKSRSYLDVFAQNNVYSPAGTRVGMTPLFDGVFNYQEFLNFVMQESTLDYNQLEASLEWFGPQVQQTLAADSKAIMQLHRGHQASVNEAKQSAMAL